MQYAQRSRSNVCTDDLNDQDIRMIADNTIAAATG